jgi:hypothetical protein
VADPLSGRVPGRASEPSRSRDNDGGGSRYVSRKMVVPLGFSRRGEYIGGGAVSGSGPRGLTPWWRGPGPGRAALGCGHPLAPLRLCFGHRLVFWKNRRFGFCFVQFREYFLCSFSETQKLQKIGNWHCGISLIG